MNPLASEIWIYIIIAYVLVSITLWIVARFSPIEWKISRPPTCDNYFADRIRRKRKNGDCKCESEIVKRAADKIAGSDRVHNKIENRLDNDSGPDNVNVNDNDNDYENNDDALHYHDWCNDTIPSCVPHAIEQMTTDRLENSKLLLSTSNGDETDDGDDELDSISDKSMYNESCEMLAHHNHRLNDPQQMHQMHQMQHNNDIMNTYDEYHYHHSSMRPPMNNHHQYEHCNSSIDSHCDVMDTHICDFVDCDGLQETELLCSENDFTLTNSFWFSIGTLMQQDDLNPKVFLCAHFSFLVGLKKGGRASGHIGYILSTYFSFIHKVSIQLIVNPNIFSKCPPIRQATKFVRFFFLIILNSLSIIS